jgi:hypothetical protein
MTIESLPLAQARAADQLLSQYLVCCPGCAKPAAVHVDARPGGEVQLARFVCPESCAVDDAVVLALLLPSARIELTA